MSTICDSSFGEEGWYSNSMQFQNTQPGVLGRRKLEQDIFGSMQRIIYAQDVRKLFYFSHNRVPTCSRGGHPACIWLLRAVKNPEEKPQLSCSNCSFHKTGRKDQTLEPAP